MDFDRIVAVVCENEDVVIGIKMVYYIGFEWILVDCTFEVAEKVVIWVMIDFGFFKKEWFYY